MKFGFVFAAALPIRCYTVWKSAPPQLLQIQHRQRRRPRECRNRNHVTTKGVMVGVSMSAMSVGEVSSGRGMSSG